MKIPKFMYNETCSVALYSGPTPRGKVYGELVENVDCRFELDERVVKTMDQDGNITSFVSKGKAFINMSGLTRDTKLIYKDNTYFVEKLQPIEGFVFSHSEVVLK